MQLLPAPKLKFPVNLLTWYIDLAHVLPRTPSVYSPPVIADENMIRWGTFLNLFAFFAFLALFFPPTFVRFFVSVSMYDYVVVEGVSERNRDRKSKSKWK